MSPVQELVAFKDEERKLFVQGECFDAAMVTSMVALLTYATRANAVVVLMALAVGFWLRFALKRWVLR